MPTSAKVHTHQVQSFTNRVDALWLVMLVISGRNVKIISGDFLALLVILLCNKKYIHIKVKLNKKDTFFFIS